jgi:hypothetical protein
MVYTILKSCSCPCALEEFVINGVTAELSDFGCTYHPTTDGCSCVFSPRKPEKWTSTISRRITDPLASQGD